MSKLTTAIHEAGHAIAFYRLFGDDGRYGGRLTIEPREERRLSGSDKPRQESRYPLLYLIGIRVDHATRLGNRSAESNSQPVEFVGCVQRHRKRLWMQLWMVCGVFMVNRVEKPYDFIH